MKPRYLSNLTSAVRMRMELAFGLFVAACGAAASPAGAAGTGSVALGPALPSAEQPVRLRALGSGSSDGVTCEQARDQSSEEINLQTGTAPDLKAKDFATILNNGSYLDRCGVPTTSRVRICAAVQTGEAVGVTVWLDPPSPELEVCVAGQVRKLAFPASAKMDIVNVNF